MTPQHDELAAAKAWWNAQIVAARNDVNRFVELAFRNDQDDLAPPFEQQWFHREWQSLWLHRPLTVIHGATGFGKTEQMLGHLLWRAGRKPTIRVGIVCKTVDKATERMLALKRKIERSPVVREVFPELQPGEPWNSEKLRLAGAGTDTTTNTFTPLGVDSDVVGARLDLIFFDDVTDDENSMTEAQRQKVITWADAAAQTRLTTDGQLHVLANAWHPADMPHVYAKRPGVDSRAYPAEAGDGRLLWPAFRPRAWLELKKRTMTPNAYARMFLCRARADGARTFRKEWFEAARRRGAGRMPVRSVPRYEPAPRTLAEVASGAFFARRHAMRVVVGVDLATGKKERKRKSDQTSLFDLGVWPNGDRQVLWVENGRWPGTVSLGRVREHEARYSPERFVVEDNGAQEFFLDFAQHFPDCTPRVEGFTTTGAKWDEALGIEAIGVELQAGRWIIPGPAEGESEEAYLARLGPEREPGESDADYLARREALNPEYREAYANICAWVQHLEDFSRGVHTPDDVMASYFAREGVMRMTAGVFQSLDLRGRSPHPASPEAEAERERHQLGNAANFNPPPAPAPPTTPLPALAMLPAGLAGAPRPDFVPGRWRLPP
ncbi:MAG TPA: hypothetical protein VFS43_38305 [Polyangiaceae bacterium]|nr:hypothetical protein [Polyangiaceae bacterium]